MMADTTPPSTRQDVEAQCETIDGLDEEIPSVDGLDDVFPMTLRH